MTSAWSEILEAIQVLQIEAKKYGSPLWYRGQRLASWPIKSAIHRHIDESLDGVHLDPPESERIELMREVSKTLFHRFRSRGWQLLEPQERSDWGIVFSMQHYGLPTRLVDWSESFVCALYFAQRGRGRTDDAAVFVLSPERLNRETIQSEGLVALGGEANVLGRVNTYSYHPGFVGSAGDMETLAVAPVLTNPRMVAQRAAFTLSGASFQPLEERRPGCVKKILLPSSVFEETERFLEIAGQDHFGYFPDLVGLREELKAAMDREIAMARQLVKKRTA